MLEWTLSKNKTVFGNFCCCHVPFWSSVTSTFMLYCISDFFGFCTFHYRVQCWAYSLWRCCFFQKPKPWKHCHHLRKICNILATLQLSCHFTDWQSEPLFKACGLCRISWGFPFKKQWSQSAVSSSSAINFKETEICWILLFQSFWCGIVEQDFWLLVNK